MIKHPLSQMLNDVKALTEKERKEIQYYEESCGLRFILKTQMEEEKSCVMQE